MLNDRERFRVTVFVIYRKRSRVHTYVVRGFSATKLKGFKVRFYFFKRPIRRCLMRRLRPESAVSIV